MAGIRIEGNTSGNVAEVDASNRVLVVPSGGTVALVNGDGDPVRTISEGRLDIGQDTLLFIDNFEEAVINSMKWLQYLTSFSALITSNMLVLNAGAANGGNSNAGVMSHRKFQYQHESAIYCHASILLKALPTLNAVAEWGFGTIASATDRSAPTDGAFFRWKADGLFELVLSLGGVEQSVAATAPTQDVIHHCEVELNSEEAVFEMDGVVLATIALPISGPPTAQSRLSTFARVYTTALTTGGPQMLIAGWAVTQQLLQTGRSESIIQTGQGGEDILSMPATPYAAAPTNQQVAPAGAAQSNTTAQVTAIAGRFNVNAAVGADLAAPVDALLQAVTVPANRAFVCTGYLISVTVNGAAIVTATSLEFSLHFNATADTLATADSFTATPQPTYAPRRFLAGMVFFPAAAAIGTSANLVVDLRSAPIYVWSGRRFGVVMRQVHGAATASLTYRGYVQPLGYWI